MELEHQELRDLAAFFAKRFPSASDRARLARAARLQVEDEVGPDDPEASWFSVLAEAGPASLAALVKAARQVDAEDPFLLELEQILAPKRDPRLVRAAMLGFGAVSTLGLGLIALVSVLSSGSEPVASPVPVLASVQETPSVDVEPVVPVRAVEAAEGSAAPEPVEAEVVEAPAVEQAPEVVKEQAPVVRRSRLPTGLPRPCFDNAQADGLVGYWYAGEEAPGSAGESLSMPETVNVRAAYPSDDNHWSSKSEVRCVIPVGTPVKLGEPVRVPPGHYWVELRVDGDGVVGF